MPLFTETDWSCIDLHRFICENDRFVYENDSCFMFENYFDSFMRAVPRDPGHPFVDPRNGAIVAISISGCLTMIWILLGMQMWFKHQECLKEKSKIMDTNALHWTTNVGKGNDLKMRQRWSHLTIYHKCGNWNEFRLLWMTWIRSIPWYVYSLFYVLLNSSCM